LRTGIYTHANPDKRQRIFQRRSQSLSAKIRTEYKQLFFYLAEANEQANKYLDRLTVDQDLKQLLTAALLARALTAYQALTLLAERGFDSEVRVTCRSLLEAKFKLGFFADDPAAPNLILAKHQQERAKVLRKSRTEIYQLIKIW
jgi:hypothetical protein